MEVVIDNMLFQNNEFSKPWGIKITTSSSTYSRSNGQVQRSVQTLKKILKKTNKENTDPYLALLECCNSPVSSMKYSLAEMLMSRRLRTKISVTTSFFTSKSVRASAELTKAQSREKRFYDRYAKFVGTFAERRCYMLSQ